METDHLEYLGVDGTIIIKWIFKKWNGGAWNGLICLRIGSGGQVVGSCACSDKPSHSVKWGKFLD